MSFTNGEDELLVQLVQRNPCLYDSQLDSYKDLVKRDHIWADISDEMYRTVDECKKRWKHIKDSYNRRIRKDKKRPGLPSTKWHLFPRLSFLDTLPFNVYDTNTTEPENAPSPQFGKIEFVDLHTETEDALSSVQSTLSDTDEREQRTKSNKRIKKEDGNLLRHRTATDDEDGLNSFSQHIKTMLTKLPPLLRIRAKNDIFNILTNFELQALSSQPLQIHNT